MSSFAGKISSKEHAAAEALLSVSPISTSAAIKPQSRPESLSTLCDVATSCFSLGPSNTDIRPQLGSLMQLQNKRARSVSMSVLEQRPGEGIFSSIGASGSSSSSSLSLKKNSL